MSDLPGSTDGGMRGMLEKVTQALADKLNNDPAWMHDISILARAAVEALREPSEGMLDEGIREYWRHNPADVGTAAVVRNVLTAMIDHILKEG